MDVNRVPGGYEKDRPWTEASQKTVAYYATEARNPGMKAAAQAELDRRKAGGVQEPPSERTQQHQQQREQQRSTAVAKTREQMLEPVSKILHGFRDAEQVTAALMLAQERAHLIAPATSTAALPEGFEIVLSAVLIDVPNETYPVLGKRGLGKTALDRIAQAAAISWNPGYTQRLDDGSDPHYCHFRAVADVLTFDNRQISLPGEVEIDAREGSPQINEIRTKAKERQAEPDYTGRKDGGDSQILELRKFLLRHAESKAMNRAVRKLGLRAAYAEKELREKPFVVARLMFTGRSDNPEYARMFAEKMADAALCARQVTYAPEPMLEDHRPSRALTHRPPPLGDERVFDITPDSTVTAGENDDAGNPPGPDEGEGQ